MKDKFIRFIVLLPVGKSILRQHFSSFYQSFETNIQKKER